MVWANGNEGSIPSLMQTHIESGMRVIPVLLPGADKIPEEFLFLRQLHAVRYPDCLDALCVTTEAQ